MTYDPHSASSSETQPKKNDMRYFRFHLPHVHLGSVFGDDWFALKAEAFARFFGTPVFLVGQTIIVALWILVNLSAGPSSTFIRSSCSIWLSVFKPPMRHL